MPAEKGQPGEGIPSILSVAFPYAPIGPLAVGGAEVICSQMEAAVAGLGFRSVVVAHARSQTEGKLYGTDVPAGTITDDLRATVEARQQANIDRALADESVALVHMHGMDFHRYRVTDVPVLVTLHLPPAWYPESIWELPANYHLVCVSESQRRACPEDVRARITVVENGVEIPELRTFRSEGRYALSLARICPEKNLHTGLDAARLAGIPAILGGEVFPYATHQRYFDEEIKPRLTSQGEVHEDRRKTGAGAPTARFLGAVSRDEKIRILSRAACLLLPSLAPETSSLVAMEALAAGVPVVGMAVGAVPEIVEHGRTGFLVSPDDHAVEQMAAALMRLKEIDRKTCREVAEERFPLWRMVEGYARLYRSRSVHRSKDGAVTRVRPQAPATGELEGRRPVLWGGEDVVPEEVRDGAGLAALEAEWAGLWSSDLRATPFQHPAWLVPWWRQFGPDGDLQAVAWREKHSRRLLGFAPSYVYRDGESGRRQLLLLGAGTSDYLEGVWSAECIDLPEVALRHMLCSGERWDLASLHQLGSRSPLKAAAECIGYELAEAEPVSVIDVSAELPAKIRANVGRYRRRAERVGGCRLEVASCPEEALGMFEALGVFHRARWEGRGFEGVLADARVLAHHRESIPKLLRAGVLRMFRLLLSGETAGILYGLADPEAREGRRLYLYLIGFGMRFAEMSPGTLLLHEVWTYARANGFVKLDLLRGGEAYKAMWGARTEQTFGLEVDRLAARQLAETSSALNGV